MRGQVCATQRGTTTQLDIYSSFFITLIVVLAPPAFGRLVRRRPLRRPPAIVLCVAFNLASIIFSSAIGNESKFNCARIIGEFFCYFSKQPAGLWNTFFGPANAANNVHRIGLLFTYLDSVQVLRNCIPNKVLPLTFNIYDLGD